MAGVYLHRMKIIRLIGVLALALLGMVGCAAPGTNQADVDNEKLAQLQMKLGAAYLNEGNLETALTKFQRALELSPNSPEAHNGIALLYQRLGKLDLAEQHFKQAVKTDSDFTAARTNYGSFLCQRGQPEAAEEQFRLAAADPLYRRRDAALFNAGLCMSRHGFADKAEEYYRQSLEINPAYAPALIQMAEFNYERKEYLPARAYLQRYQEVAQATARSLWLGYRVESELGDKNAASSYAVSLRGKFPDSPEAARLD